MYWSGNGWKDLDQIICTSYSQSECTIYIVEPGFKVTFCKLRV